MAHTTRTPARIQRLTSLVAIVAVAVAIAVAFGRVFQAGAVTGKLLVVGVATALVAWALERRSLLLATLAEVGLLLVLLGVIVFRDTTWNLLPGLETLRAIGNAAAAVGEQARVQAAPAPPVIPLVFASVAAVWAAVFSCHALAFRAGSPLLALVPPAALVVFVDSVLEDDVRALYGIVFLLAALAVLFADSLRRMQGWGPVWNGPGRGDRLIPGAGRNARMVVSAVLAVAVVTPFLIPGFGGRATIDISKWGGEGDVNLSALVSMASQLTQGEPRDVFEVETNVPSYYRMTALDQFDGVTWTPREDFSTEVVAGTVLPTSEPVAGGEESTQKFTFVTDQTFPWLPTTYQPTSLEIPGGAAWDQDSETVKIDEMLEADEGYTVHSRFIAPSQKEVTDAFFREGMDPVYTSLPVDTPPAIEDLARDLTEDAATDFERVIAIQDYLTSSAFHYSTDVAYREDMSTIVDFLMTTRTGFCQQFATAMAVLLRSIGIPARVAVGFTDGDPIPNGYRVQTDDYHAWVEVPFTGYGWLQFEPTKGQVNPIARTYNDPLVTPCRGKSCSGDGGGGGNGGAQPTPAQEFPESGPFLGDATQQSAQRKWILGIGITIASLIGGLLLLLVIVRRRGRRHERDLAVTEPREAIVRAYVRFAGDARAAGLGRTPGETPVEYLARVAPQLEGTEPLDRLTALTVVAAYGRDDPTTDDALDAIADADEASRAVRRSLPWYRRWRRSASV